MSDTAEGYKISLDAQLEKLEEILKENPDDPSVLMHVGELSLRRGRKLMALLAFQKVASLKPEVLEVHLHLAKIYGFQKMYEEAYQELLQALKIDRKSVEARVLYDILSKESDPPPELAAKIQSYFSPVYTEDEITLYIQQLNIEKEGFVSDIRELSSLLESYPLDTILEYHKNMAERRLSLVEELLEKAQQLKTAEPSSYSQATITPEHEVSVEPEPREVPPPQEQEMPHPQEIAPLEEKPLEEVVVQDQEAREEPALPPPVEVPSMSREDLEKIFHALRENLESIMQSFKKTKGISAVLVFHLKGELIHVIQDGTFNFAEAVRALSRYLETVFTFSEGFLYWVMEFDEGIIVLQSIAPKLFICAVGDSTTSFGALRFQMDKNRPFFLEAVKSIDFSGLG
jgi:tetratricopeptide (TPR) repeat protein